MDYVAAVLIGAAIGVPPIPISVIQLRSNPMVPWLSRVWLLSIIALIASGFAGLRLIGEWYRPLISIPPSVFTAWISGAVSFYWLSKQNLDYD